MKRSAILALALYAAFLLGIAVWRPWATPAAPFSGRWDLVPFMGTADLWRAGIVPFVFLFVGNVACFVPFGFGLPALTPLRRAVVPLCFLGSLLIEALQWAFGTGVPQVEDVLLNTLGAALGYALFCAVHSATRSPAADESHAENAEGAEFDSHEARTIRFVRKCQTSTDIFVIITKNHLYFRGRL